MLLISYIVMFWRVLDRDSSLSIVAGGFQPESRRIGGVCSSLSKASHHVTKLSHCHLPYMVYPFLVRVQKNMFLRLVHPGAPETTRLSN